VQPGHSCLPYYAVEYSKNDNDADPVSGKCAHLTVRLFRFAKRFDYRCIQSIKRSPYPGMNEGMGRFDDDGDLIVVAVAQPVEGPDWLASWN